MKTCNIDNLIIEAFNTFIKNKYGKDSGFLILKKVIMPYSTIKAYKHYEYYIYHHKKVNNCIIRFNYTDRVVTEEDKTRIEKEMTQKLIMCLYELIDNKLLEDIINGNYSTDTN